MQTATPHVLEVSELTKKVRFILESEFHTVWLTGEISNLTMASSGHWYLSLKDPKSQVRCAMFRGANRFVRIKPQNGQQVLVKARVSLYEPRGDFQLIIEHMEDAGDGLLKQKYEQLKMALSAQGLFDNTHKKPLPSFIQRVGIVTSPTGAAVKDVISVLKRRNAGIELIVYPSLVQGADAAQSIVQQIEIANLRQEVDLLIVGRGGGSLEDLWAFNEEAVVKAIFSSQLPIVSAVGHEIDHSLSDLVADVRAATPSAAAEIVSADSEQLATFFGQTRQRLLNLIQQRMSAATNLLRHNHHRLERCHPTRQLLEQSQKLDNLQLRLQTQMQAVKDTAEQRAVNLQMRLLAQNPGQVIQLNKTKHQHLNQRLFQAITAIEHNKKQQFAGVINNLHLVSPLATIARGYSVARDKDEKIIRSIEQSALGETIEVQVKDGRISAEVKDIQANK